MRRVATKLVLMLLPGCGLVWAGLLWSGPAGADDFEVGLDAFRAGDAGQARDVWTPLAEEGDAAAQYSLAKLYEKGGGPIERDLTQAVKWYEMAAAQGLPAAQNNLALMYAQGRGVEANAERAAELWRSAAEQDYPWGQYNLGLAYFRGHGVEIDRTEATAWFRRAADGELAPAQFIMGQLRREGIVVEKDHGQAQAWYRRAAKQGHLDAMKQAQVLEAAGVTAQPLAPPEVSPKPAPGTQAEQAQVAASAPLAATDEQNASTGQAAPALEAVKPEDVAPAAPATEAAQAETAAQPEPEPVPLPSVKPAVVQKAVLPANGVATQAEAKAKTETGTYRVWLASAGSENEAMAIWQAARARHPAIFSEADAVFSRIELSGGDVFIRILAGPMASETAAAGFCQRLRDAQPAAFCKVQAN